MPIYNPTGSSSTSYKVYSAIMNQSGVANPTAIVLQNTLSGAINWTRVGAGVYGGGLIGEFTIGKTWCMIGQNDVFSGTDPDKYLFSIYPAGLNNIGLESQDLAGGIVASQDDLIIGISIEIRVYP